MVRKLADKKIRRLVVILFFVLFFAYGVISFRDYGVSTDEWIERDSTLINYKRMFPWVMKYKTDTVDFEGLADLSEWKDRYYGVSLQIPAVIGENLFGFELNYRRIYQMKHLYSFSLFFAATIFFYFLAKELMKKDYWALLATAMLILSPRLLVESFYNMKDLYFVSIFIINLFFAVKFMQKPGWKWMIFLGISTGFCVNTRIVGGVLIALSLLFTFIRSIRQKTWKKQLPFMVGAGVISLGMYILVTPITWTNTVQEILNVMKTFSNYVKWPYDFLYLGESVNALELPWHYLFVWIGITVPLAYLALFAFGLVTQAGQGILRINKKQGLEVDFWAELIMILLVVIPFLYVIVKRPVLYTGWRHFYFIYPIMILFAAMGIKRIWEYLIHRKVIRYVLMGAFGVYLLSIGGWLLRNHPHEYMYFNRIGRTIAAENVERDYWALSAYDCLLYIIETDPRPEIKVYMEMTYSDFMLPPEHRQRLVAVQTPEEADYVIEGYRDDRESVDYYRWNQYKELYRVEVDGIKAQSVFRREFQYAHSSTVYEYKDHISYGADGIKWTEENEGKSRILTGELPSSLAADKLTLKADTDRLPKSSRLLISSDGITYTDVSAFEDYTKTANALFSTFDSQQTIRYVKIVHSSGGNEEFQWNLCMYTRPGAESTDLMSCIETVSTNYNEDTAKLAIDSDPMSFWTSGVSQAKGMEYDIVLKDDVLLDGIALERGNKTDDYPRNLEIYVGNSADELHKVEAAVSEDYVHYTFDAVKCRYVRLKLGDTPADVGWNWAIAQLSLFIREP